MRGHVRKRGSKWVAIVDVGRDENGKRIQKWHSGFDRRADAERKLTQILGRIESGSYVEPAKLTLGNYLRETWLPSIAASVRASTLARYRIDVETIANELGHVALQRLSGQQIDALYAKRLEGGSAPRSVRHLHAVLRRALRDAVRNDLVMRNAADAATAPRVPRPELQTWTVEELRHFLGDVSEDRLHAAWLLLATTGMRRGEVLGLRWGDVDGSRISVSRSLVSVRNELSFSEPKTSRGRRAIALDKDTLAELREHRKRQLAERMGLGLGKPSRDGLIFTDPLGEPVKPDSFSQRFLRLVGELELPQIRLHDLRHTAASLMLAAGVHPKVVSERLGHASVAFTLDTYSHVAPAMESDAAERVAAMLRN